LTPETSDYLFRAEQALKTAIRLAEEDPDGAVSRAYYAAFYAASALFANEGRTFTKHASLEAAIHRDLVKAGRWPISLGKDYTFLMDLRTTGDYGVELHATVLEAKDAFRRAENILKTAKKIIHSP
jgi:uncharacterized protein (UPF0332 family)